MGDHIEANAIPFIMLFSKPRRNAEALPGRYDNELDVMVLDVAGQKMPLIKTSSMPELITFTRVQRESNDEQENPIMQETVTKTAVSRESDDHSNYLLETMTKTFTERESDDDSLGINELYTKTEVDREQEDTLIGLPNDYHS
ncbi:MAG: hypothetical protein QY316_12985 [Thermodesulfobacteriota bacterium]|nr:MAG: hypothetical protein QY316_12985 [Thermodesulfobacteriota bacterium]